jgi:DNA repair exonuclease SbcCD ATPase subunit
VSKDLNDYRTRRRNEVERLRNIGIDIGAFDELRKQLQSLPPQDYEDARTCDAQLVSTKAQIAQGEEAVSHARHELERLNGEQQENKNKNKRFGLLSGVVMVLSLCGTGAVFLFLHPMNWLFVDLTIALDSIFLVFTAVFSVLVLRPHYFKRSEYQSTENSLDAECKNVVVLKEKITALEVRLDTLAHKSHIFNTGGELLLRLRDFGEKVPNLRDLEYLDKTIISSDASLSQLRTGVEPYFARAGRMTLEIRPDTTAELSTEISGYVNDAKELQTVYGPAKSAKEQMEFLTSEIKEIQKQLLDNFIKAKMEHLHDYNESLREFHAKVGQYQQWNSMKAELHRLENDMSSGFVPDELPPQIERLERARKEKTAAMLDLVNKTPSILDLAPKAQVLHNSFVNVSTYSQKSQPAVTKRNIDTLKAERDNVTNLVRAANSSDANYVLMLEELKIVQAELTIVKRVKTALEHARDQIVQEQTTSGIDWRLKLNDIMEDMLTDMGIENPNYDVVLADTAGGSDIDLAGSLLGKPFSLLTMEQVRWFARVIVTRVLALNESFPLILNEPFGLGDEPVREHNMPFIFSLLDLKYQVLALTSDATRFESAYRAASDDQKKALHTCARVALGN